MAPDQQHSLPASSDYPRPTALLAFLEADLDRGLRLARQAKLGWESTHCVAPELLAELDAVHIDVLRWLNRARARHIETRHLSMRAYQFTIALAEVRRLSGAEGEPE